MTSLTTSNAEIGLGRCADPDPAIPMRPLGFGQAGAFAALALLDDGTTSPASRRLASAPAALGTRPIVLSPRAARDGPCARLHLKAPF